MTDRLVAQITSGLMLASGIVGAAVGIESHVVEWDHIGTPRPARLNELELHFIDVGQGDSTLIVCPNGNRILVDAGSSGGLTLAGKGAVADYVSAHLDREMPRLEALVITHPDADHYNLLPDLLRGVSVDRLLYGGSIYDFSFSFQRWLRAFERTRTGRLLAASDVPDRPAHPSKLLNCGEAGAWILASNTLERTKRKNFVKNTPSIVLRLAFGQFEAILTGDATTTTEDMITASFPAAWLDIDLLKLGHHGSAATSNSSEWLFITTPEIAIASAGLVARGNSVTEHAANAYGHPRKLVFDRTLASGSVVTAPENGVRPHRIRSCTDRSVCSDETTTQAVYSTVLSGTVVVRSTSDGWSVQEKGDIW